MSSIVLVGKPTHTHPPTHILSRPEAGLSSQLRCLTYTNTLSHLDQLQLWRLRMVKNIPSGIIRSEVTLLFVFFNPFQRSGILHYWHCTLPQEMKKHSQIHSVMKATIHNLQSLEDTQANGTSQYPMQETELTELWPLPLKTPFITSFFQVWLTFETSWWRSEQRKGLAIKLFKYYSLLNHKKKKSSAFP